MRFLIEAFWGLIAAGLIFAASTASLVNIPFVYQGF